MTAAMQTTTFQRGRARDDNANNGTRRRYFPLTPTYL